MRHGLREKGREEKSERKARDSLTTDMQLLIALSACQDHDAHWAVVCSDVQTDPSTDPFSADCA